MNLWFRLLLLLFRRPWRKRVDGLATTVIRMRVWPLDLDFNRHVTNGRYFTLADVGLVRFRPKDPADAPETGGPTVAQSLNCVSQQNVEYIGRLCLSNQRNVDISAADSMGSFPYELATLAKEVTSFESLFDR